MLGLRGSVEVLGSAILTFLAGPVAECFLVFAFNLDLAFLLYYATLICTQQLRKRSSQQMYSASSKNHYLQSAPLYWFGSLCRFVILVELLYLQFFSL